MIVKRLLKIRIYPNIELLIRSIGIVEQLRKISKVPLRKLQKGNRFIKDGERDYREKFGKQHSKDSQERE